MDGADFDFVKNEALKKNIEDSIKFLSTLWLFSEKNKEDREEIYRTIIIYQASIVEALLLHYCERKKIPFTEIEYAFCNQVTGDFYDIKSDKYHNAKMFFGLKHEINKPIATLADATVKLKNNLLGIRLFTRIEDLKEKRNTVHLFKTRDAITKKDVEKATETLLWVVRKLSKKLK